MTRKRSCYVGFYVTFHLRCTFRFHFSCDLNGRFELCCFAFHNYLKGNIQLRISNVHFVDRIDVPVCDSVAFLTEINAIVPFFMVIIFVIDCNFSDRNEKMTVWHSDSFTAFVTHRSTFDGIYCRLTGEKTCIFSNWFQKKWNALRFGRIVNLLVLNMVNFFFFFWNSALRKLNNYINRSINQWRFWNGRNKR